MDATFTVGQLYAVIAGILTFIVTCGGAAAVISKMVVRIKSPNAEQDKKINQLTERVDKIEVTISKHAAHLKRDEEGDRVTQEAIYALLSHAIDGNNISDLKEAQKHLKEFLINK